MWGMAKKHIAKPHLIPEGNYHRCSVCGYPFAADVYPTLDAAFAEHMANAHQRGRTSEDVNHAAAGIVRETTKD